MKRLVPYALVLATGLAAGYGLARVHVVEKDDPIAPGTEIRSILDDYIFLLSFTSKGGTVTAQRSKQGAQFAVQATSASDRPTQRCIAPPDLGGQLASFSSFIAKRQISLSERSEAFPEYVGQLLVQSGSEEPDEPFMVFTNRSHTAVAFIFRHHAAEMTIPLAAFKQLERGCSELNRI